MTAAPGFINKFLTPVLSSEVGDLEFMTNGNHAEISVRRASSSECFYEAILYPNSEGICTAWQLGDVITDWMKANNVIYASFVFEEKVTDISFNAIVMRCDRIAPGGFTAVKNKPLMSSEVSVVPAFGSFAFYALADTSAKKSLSALVRGVMDDGSVLSANVSLSPDYIDGIILYKSISIQQLLVDVNSYLEESEMMSVKSVYVSMGNPPVSSLSAAVYVSNDQDMVGFSFRNCFGCLEHIWLHAEVLPEVSVDSESASIGHKVVQYDVETSQIFKVEASNIAEPEYHRVSQFVSSSEVFEISSGKRIIISDVTYSAPTSYDSLGSLKFSFSYDDDRLSI